MRKFTIPIQKVLVPFSGKQEIVPFGNPQVRMFKHITTSTTTVKIGPTEEFFTQFEFIPAWADLCEGGNAVRKDDVIEVELEDLPMRVTVIDHDGSELDQFMPNDDQLTFKCPKCDMTHFLPVTNKITFDGAPSGRSRMMSFSCRSIENPMGCGTRTQIEFLNVDEKEAILDQEKPRQIAVSPREFWDQIPPFVREDILLSSRRGRKLRAHTFIRLSKMSYNDPSLPKWVKRLIDRHIENMFERYSN